MSKVQVLELEQFFSDLQNWNRVVICDPHAVATGEREGGDDQVHDQAEKRLFIHVDCDTSQIAPVKNAKLA